ncbi:MAG: tetratricopeptide repeat protein, partial [Gammaproteobacteria bacterium]|nr:tetratricopeptide repeat protein [Gammaproteobacteria bacterium]
MKTVCTPIAILLALSPFFAGCSPPVDSQTRMESAREHEARGDHVTAILELKNLLQTDADHVPALVRVGRLSLYAGQSAESIAFLERARTLGAPDEEVLEPLGRALLAQGHFQQVLDAIDPDSVAAVHRGRLHLLLAEAHLNLGDTEAARKAYMAAQQDASLVANALSGLADLERREGRYDSAQQLLDQALDDDPFSVVANRGVGALKIDQQRYEEAMDAFVRSIEATQIRPGSDELLLARVGMTETQWRMGQRNRALGNVKDLLNAYPWHPLPRYLRALLAYDSGEYELAGEYLREVLEIVPRHFPSTRLLAAVEFELENYANVELLLRDYLVTFPNDIEMRRLSAATHLRMGNAARAMAVLMPALEQGFDDNRFLTLLGRASLHSGDPETAAAYLTRAMSLDPTNQQTLVSLIFALITTGEITRAEAALRRIPDTRQTEETRQLLHLVML